ncbi:MAG TPA: glycerol-3-phosphate dehydrogenase/oxidase [Planctomycetaceae bacterium]|jgi:glycerol-3-phosphate dehydrogenase|nr:glycerol-3-phosphate dehydrogenase/oxidase [Planctomycetaceae bacterium]
MSGPGTTGGRPKVLILGAGINGCSVARELVLNGVDVWLVEKNDIAFGATSRASRLIHGGLRYLEYADFHLVRESLNERTRLCKLAGHLVEPLRLYIPVAERTSGLIQSGLKFAGVTRSSTLNWLTQPLQHKSERGLWAIEIGLSLYDRFAADPNMPPHTVHEPNEPGVPRVDRSRFRWLCGYSDAQMRFPERYCVALLEDARQIAETTGVEFRLFTYSQAQFVDDTVKVTDARGVASEMTLAILVNATGAWGDLTLGQLHVPAPRLFGGTKGSHFVSYQPALKQAIGRAGVYAEAADGRLIFVLPFGDAVLVGTTDERFDGPPETAVASDAELGYLVSTVNELFPDVHLTRDDVTLTYSGVRPLPYVGDASEASISRDHSIAVHAHGRIPVLTLVGGKLTTSRALGELVTDAALERLGIARSAMTIGRYLPGSKGLPEDASQREIVIHQVAAEFGLSHDQTSAIWELCGTLTSEILRHQQSADADPRRWENIAGSALPRTFVRWVIEHERVERLEDLVERRLMLLYTAQLSRCTLEELSDVLIERGRLSAVDKPAAIDRALERLSHTYARQL